MATDLFILLWPTAIPQAYGELYADMIESYEMENFVCCDLNRDSFEEANRSNATIEEFKQVDANNDGFVHPSEFDASLIQFRRFQIVSTPSWRFQASYCLINSLKSSMVDLFTSP